MSELTSKEQCSCKDRDAMECFMERNGRRGQCWCPCHQTPAKDAEEMIDATHDETGRTWSGLRRDLPRGYSQVYPRTSKKVSRVPWNTPMSDADYLARLKSQCIITASGCWEKQGHRRVSKGMEHHGPERGYGFMCYRNKTWAAHRLAWKITHGDIPAGMKVLHKCDNPPCCNPDHLELGDDRKNMQEAGKRRRWPRQFNSTCKHGHPRTPENVLYHGREKKMRCQVCQLIKWRRAAGWPEHLLTIPKVPNGYSHEQVTRNAT